MPLASTAGPLKNKRIGLALGGGAARGIAHIGVVKVLEGKGILPDMIAGTSMGSIVGAIYAKDLDASRLEGYAAEWSRWKTAQLLDPALPRIGLIKGRKTEDILASYLGDVMFSELKVPYACVAADIDTGEEVVIKEGLVVSGVRASISIPGIFLPVERDGRYLVDGGLVNPVPVSVVRSMGADFVIAVNVLPNPAGRFSEQGDGETTRGLNIFEILLQAVHISSNLVARASLHGADLVIEPDVSHVSPLDFHLACESIPIGMEAAERALASLGL